MTTYQGGCHCGAVRFEAELELEGLTTCNCSICGKTGAIMLFVPATQLRQTSGRAALTDYQFGKKSIHHRFCKTCGVRCFAEGQGEDGKAWAMINARCLDGVDVHTLEVTQRYDEKSLWRSWCRESEHPAEFATGAPVWLAPKTPASPRRS